jgi:hypothetical protein
MIYFLISIFLYFYISLFLYFSTSLIIIQEKIPVQEALIQVNYQGLFP